MKIVETDRLILRRFRPEDLDELYEVSSDPEIMRFVGDGRPISRVQTQRWIEKSLENYRTHGLGCLAVVAKEDGAFIGYSGLVNLTKDRGAELIYALKKQYWGGGLASEAAQGMLSFGLGSYGLRRVIATIDPDNQASLRIVEKLGMKYQEQRLDENNLPEVVYAIEAADHKAWTDEE